MRRNRLLPRVKGVRHRGVAKATARLLRDAGLHGHKHAVDATVAETALRRPGPVGMTTSDLDDTAGLCGDRIRLRSV